MIDIRRHLANAIARGVRGVYRDSEIIAARWIEEQLKEFEATVRAHEREACAVTAETDAVLDWSGGSTGNAKGTAQRIAAAIRSER